MVKMAIHDKYGRAHLSRADARFADMCYEMMEMLTTEQGLTIASAEKLVADLMEHGYTRSRFTTFVEACKVNASSKVPVRPERQEESSRIKLAKKD